LPGGPFRGGTAMNGEMDPHRQALRRRIGEAGRRIREDALEAYRAAQELGGYPHLLKCTRTIHESSGALASFSPFFDHADSARPTIPKVPGYCGPVIWMEEHRRIAPPVQRLRLELLDLNESIGARGGRRFQRRGSLLIRQLGLFLSWLEEVCATEHPDFDLRSLYSPPGDGEAGSS
jgi:hypothetical protein